MHKQIGVGALEYECCVLEALNNRDRNDILLRKELSLSSPDAIADLESTINSTIEDRESKIAKYKEKIDELLLDHDPQSNLLSSDALEFLYQEYIENELRFILKEISDFYDNNVSYLLSNEVTYFTRSARKIAKHNLYSYAVGYIVHHHLATSKAKQLDQAISLLSSKFITEFHADHIERVISQKYDYFADRLVHCIEIGNMIRSL